MMRYHYILDDPFTLNIYIYINCSGPLLFEFQIHPQKQTWNPRMMQNEDEFPFQWGDFQVPS